MNQQSNKSDITGKVETYQDRLRDFIRKRVRSAEDVKDILQEVMYQLAKADYLMQPIEKLESWLYSVTRSKIIDWSRKKKNLLFADVYKEDDNELLPEDLSDILFNEAETPEDKYLQSMVWQQLESALEELPREQRDIFTMTEMEGLSYQKIAKKTGVNENTLISRKRYAILFLRKRLQVFYEEFMSY